MKVFKFVFPGKWIGGYGVVLAENKAEAIEVLNQKKYPSKSWPHMGKVFIDSDLEEVTGKGVHILIISHENQRSKKYIKKPEGPASF